MNFNDFLRSANKPNKADEIKNTCIFLEMKIRHAREEIDFFKHTPINEMRQEMINKARSNLAFYTSAMEIISRFTY